MAWVTMACDVRSSSNTRVRNESLFADVLPTSKIGLPGSFPPFRRLCVNPHRTRPLWAGASGPAPNGPRAVPKQTPTRVRPRLKSKPRLARNLLRAGTSRGPCRGGLLEFHFRLRFLFVEHFASGSWLAVLQVFRL